MPIVKATLVKIFPAPNVVDDSIAPDEVFALGASVVASSTIPEDMCLGLPVSVAGVAHDLVVTTDDGSSKVRSVLFIHSI